MNVATAEALTIEDLKGEVEPDWCPGCGDFAVLQSLERAALSLGIHPHELVVVSGIGCSSNLPGFLHSYGIHSLHGRAVAVATGVKLANPALKVVITGGDGDGYGIGAGHFLHAMRRNVDLTYVVMDNQVYGLTTGQVSPTSSMGMKTKSTPQGNPERPVNPIALALAGGASFVARGFSGQPAHLAELLRRAVAHRGFSLVDVFSPCVTFNKDNTYAWFKERIYKLDETGHDPSHAQAAMLRALEWGERIPIGVFFEEDRPLYDDLDPVLSKGNPMERPLGITQETGRELLAELS